MMKGPILLEDIESKLSYFQTTIRNSNANNRMDINRYAEPIYKPILNEIFAADFNVLEYELQNTPGVDLGCLKTGIAVQVTSESNAKKVKKTILKFLNPQYKYLESYQKLYILFIGKPFIGDKNFEDKLREYIKEANHKYGYKETDNLNIIETTSLWNVSTVIKKIEEKFLTNIPKLREIHEYVSQQLQEPFDKERYIDSKILRTIDSLNSQTQQCLDIPSALTYIIEQFDNLLVLPPHFFTNLYPFRKNGRAHYSCFAIHTDNEELFRYFEALTKIHTTNIIDDSTRKIIDFFERNLIEHLHLIINPADNSSFPEEKRICIHTLFEEKQCNCERCTYNRLDFFNSFRELKSFNPNRDTVEKLRQPYIFYQYGEFKKAVESYWQLAQSFESNNQVIAAFLCYFNLTKLARFISDHYWEDDQKEIIESLDSIDLDIKILRLRQNETVKSEVIKILQWIKESNFIHDTRWRISQTSKSIFESNRIDQYGGFSSHSYQNQLVTTLSQLTVFLESNLIVYDNFSDYSESIMDVFEGLLALYTVQNNKSSKYDTFDDYIINLLIFHADAERVNNLFQKYHVSVAEYKSENHTESLIFNRILNLTNSLDTIASVIKNDGEAKNYFFTQKINRIFSNILVILARFSVPTKELNYYLIQLIRFAQQADFLYPSSIDYFSLVISYKTDTVSQETLEHLLLLSLTEDKFKSHKIRRSIWSGFKPGYIITNTSVLEQILSRLSAGDVTKNYHLLELGRFLPTSEKNRLSESINARLRQEFHIELYYEAVIFDIINYPPFFEEFLKIIPRKINKPQTFEEAFGKNTDKKNAMNYLLSNLINIAYKFDINLQEERFQELHCGNPYYQWLMNLETFDYSQFNAYWILRYQTVYYFKAFQKVPKVHQAIREALNEKYTEGLAKVYFKYIMVEK